MKTKQFKRYSDFWATLINLRENKYASTSLKEYLYIASTKLQLPLFQSLQEFNTLLLKKLGLNPEEGFSIAELNSLELSLN